MPLDENGLPDHFPMGPSSSYRWIPCPGSLTQPPPNEESEAAKRGTLGHSMAEAKLKGEILSSEDYAYFEGLSEYDKAELKEGVAVCVDFVKGLGLRYVLEKKLQSDFIPEHGGTVDVIAYDNDTIHVVDFKFGRMPVDVENNTQVMCYLNLARQRVTGRKRFLGTIIQPFCGGIKGPLEFSKKQLDANDGAVLNSSISREFKAGDHCKFCHLLAGCKTAAKFVHDQIESEFPDLTKLASEAKGKPTKTQVAKVAAIYKLYKMAEKGSEAASEVLKTWARIGVDLAPHGLGIQTSPRVSWDKDRVAEVMAAAKVPKDDWCEETPLPVKVVRERLGISKESFNVDFADALKIIEVEKLVIGKGGQTEFPEFD